MINYTWADFEKEDRNMTQRETFRYIQVRFITGIQKTYAYRCDFHVTIGTVVWVPTCYGLKEAKVFSSSAEHDYGFPTAKWVRSLERKNGLAALERPWPSRYKVRLVANPHIISSHGQTRWYDMETSDRCYPVVNNSDIPTVTVKCGNIHRDMVDGHMVVKKVDLLENTNTHQQLTKELEMDFDEQIKTL